MRLILLLLASYSGSLFGLFGSTAAPLATANQPSVSQVQEKKFTSLADLLKRENYKAAIQLLQHAQFPSTDEVLDEAWMKSVIKDAQQVICLFATRKKLKDVEIELFGLAVQMVASEKGCLPAHALEAIRANKKCMQFFEKNPQWQKYLQLTEGEEMKTASPSKRRAREMSVRGVEQAAPRQDQKEKSPVVSAKRALILDDTQLSEPLEHVSSDTESPDADSSGENTSAGEVISELSTQREIEATVVEQVPTVGLERFEQLGNLTEADLGEPLEVVQVIDQRNAESGEVFAHVVKESKDAVDVTAKMDMEYVVVEMSIPPAPPSTPSESAVFASEGIVTLPVQVVGVSVPALLPGADSTAREADSIEKPEPFTETDPVPPLAKTPDEPIDVKKARLSLPKMGIMAAVVAVLGYAGKRYYDSRVRDSRS